MILMRYADLVNYVPVEVALCEYLFVSIDDESIRQEIQQCRLLRLVRLGLASHISGSDWPPVEAWDDPSQFIIDKQNLSDVIKQALGPSKSLGSVFESVRTLIGLSAGLLTHKRSDASIPFEKFYDPNSCELTDEYEKFLCAENLTLDDGHETFRTARSDLLRLHAWNGIELPAPVRENSERTTADLSATISLEELELSVRTYNALKRANVNSLEELLKLTYDDFMNIRNFGKKSTDEVIEKLQQLRLS